MVTSLTAMLVMVADISNMASFYVVVAVFALMFLFILRRIGQDLLDPQSAVSHVHHVPPQTTMSKVGVPFTFSLLEGGGDSYSQLGVRTSSQVSQIILKDLIQFYTGVYTVLILPHQRNKNQVGPVAFYTPLNFYSNLLFAFPIFKCYNPQFLTFLMSMILFLMFQSQCSQ